MSILPPSVIDEETARLATISQAIAVYGEDRLKEINRHDAVIKDLEQERLDVRSGWHEKNDLTEKLKEQSYHDPRKYLPAFIYADSPYVGVVRIKDDNPKIGSKEYVLGKQSLISGTTALIVDWRKADVSQFYYDYEEGEDYEVDIHNVERIGIITHRREVAIAKKELTRIKTGKETFTLKGGAWLALTGDVVQTVSADIKAETEDHTLIDIIALIKPDQFRAITKPGARFVYLTGGAGAGKTTVALHRASMLQFNEPEKYQQERTMVVVFNRTLKDYMKRTSQELLGKTRIETFSSWALMALPALGCQPFELSTSLNAFDDLKKSSKLPALLAEYVKLTKLPKNEVEDLIGFYRSPTLTSCFFNPDEATVFETYVHNTYDLSAKKPTISFSDMAILLRLLQLRSRKKTVDYALNYFAHLVIDEGQDFSQLELEAIVAAANENQSVTLCADPKQKILSFVDAEGFDAVKMKLQAGGLDQTTFTIGYRSHPKIMAVANLVAAGEQALPQKDCFNNPVVRTLYASSRDEALDQLVKEITRLQKLDRGGLTCIITKGKQEIKAIHEALKAGQIKNLHPVGTIGFTPGVLVVNAHQVKGLEFTNVVIWNPSGKNYRVGVTEDRNLLYVAVSRACKRVSFVIFDKVTRLLGI